MGSTPVSEGSKRCSGEFKDEKSSKGPPRKTEAIKGGKCVKCLLNLSVWCRTHGQEANYVLNNCRDEVTKHEATFGFEN